MDKEKIGNAVIMAAGRGIRMMPLTEEIPKAMAPLSGSTLIADGISKLKGDIEFIHITVGYKGSMLASHVIEHDVSSVFNTEGKGNSWWLYNTLIKQLDEPILVLTCDNVIEMDFHKFMDDYVQLGNPACMVVPVVPVQGLEGDFIHKNANNYVNEICREKSSDLYCSGIQILNPSKINKLTNQAEDFTLVWKQLIEKKQLGCSSLIPDKWYAVDNLNQLKDINSI
jgi:NDP-sugar pyrophosphorylase family protein